MFEILRHYGIPAKIVQAIRTIYNNSRSSVIVDGILSEEFDISTGVLQGDTLAPKLLIIVMDYVLKTRFKIEQKTVLMASSPTPEKAQDSVKQKQRRTSMISTSLTTLHFLKAAKLTARINFTPRPNVQKSSASKSNTKQQRS